MEYTEFILLWYGGNQFDGKCNRARAGTFISFYRTQLFFFSSIEYPYILYTHTIYCYIWYSYNHFIHFVYVQHFGWCCCFSLLILFWLAPDSSCLRHCCLLPLLLLPFVTFNPFAFSSSSRLICFFSPSARFVGSMVVELNVRIFAVDVRIHSIPVSSL